MKAWERCLDCDQRFRGELIYKTPSTYQEIGKRFSSTVTRIDERLPIRQERIDGRADAGHFGAGGLVADIVSEQHDFGVKRFCEAERGGGIDAVVLGRADHEHLGMYRRSGCGFAFSKWLEHVLGRIRLHIGIHVVDIPGQ